MTLLRLFPLPVIVRRPHRANASNNLWRIVLNTALPGGQPAAAILAQERFEWGYKWKHLFGVDRVDMELRGHAVECHVAHRFYGLDLDGYERVEAYALQQHYPQFVEVPVSSIVSMLRIRREAAAQWCAQHDGFIQWALRVTGERA